MNDYDFIIIGGGLFGIYSALYLSKKNLKVCLIEKDNELLNRASKINQARLHQGYHYPRSISTALLANEYKERFYVEHKDFVNTKFDQYYAIAKHGSYTDKNEFKRFCNYLNLKVEEISNSPLVNYHFLDGLFLTEEYSFDPVMIAEYYKRMINDSKKIDVINNSIITEAQDTNGSWKLKGKTKDGPTFKINGGSVINATYSSTNTINKLFDIQPLGLLHQITEVALVHSTFLENIGITVMDGYFFSIMPFGKSQLHSLSSVNYTHHKFSEDSEPKFDCQESIQTCNPKSIENCNTCEAKPTSNFLKMKRQMEKYLSPKMSMDHLFSLFTIKSKLKSSYIDDGRPTEIKKLKSNPDFYCIFSGKINSIYEIEKELLNV